jgi:hypothetical protein
MSVVLLRSWMLETVPSWTPRKLTGEPTVSPATLPSNAMTHVTGRLNHARPPTTRTTHTARAMPPSTNTPIKVGLARFAIPRPSSLLSAPRPPAVRG